MSATLALPSAAEAAYPGANGRIAWESNEGGSDQEIVTTHADGSVFQQLTNNTTDDRDPAWSPDGTKIAFSRFNAPFWEVWVMDANGANQQALVTSLSTGTDNTNPTWSRDGSRIAFTVDGGPNNRFIFRADTSAPNTNVTNVFTGADSIHPAYAPNSNRIAFGRSAAGAPFVLYTVDDNGNGLAQLVSAAGQNIWAPAWSPDGLRVAYERFNGSNYDVYAVNADGTGNIFVEGSSADEFGPAWAPEGNMITFTRASPAGSPDTEIYTEGQLTTQGGGSSAPVATRAATADSRPDFQPVVAAQVRPRGATPMRVSLVPAFDQCTSPNATHSGPFQLNVPSCVPPRATNPDATVGEPLVNGKGANFIGSVTIRALANDLQFAINVTDVRCARVGPGCTGGPLSDYLGALFVKLEIRVTDRSNPAGKAGTVQDITLPVNPPSNIPATCAATADTTVGSTCSAVVSLNSRIPGAIVPDRRSIWRIRSLALQTFRTNVFTDFAVPGVFVP